MMAVILAVSPPHTEAVTKKKAHKQKKEPSDDWLKANWSPCPSPVSWKHQGTSGVGMYTRESDDFLALFGPLSQISELFPVFLVEFIRLFT